MEHVAASRVRCSAEERFRSEAAEPLEEPYVHKREKALRASAEHYIERLALCPDHRDKATGRCIVCQAEERTRQELRAAAQEASAWRPIADFQRNSGRVRFWVVPLTAEETYTDLSGNPIVSRGDPHHHDGTSGSWGALWKATHWMPIPIVQPPSPPATTGGSK